jgi:hypothetical protein
LTCGSKKHIEEALAKIRVKDIEDSQNQRQKESKPKRRRDSSTLANLHT